MSRCYPHPDSVLAAVRALPFVCPLCRGGLDVQGQAYRCRGCVKVYPVEDGIPDFRVFPDPFLSFAEDRRRTDLILRALSDYTLEGLLEYYWSYSDITPPALRPRFIRSALLSEGKARHLLERVGDTRGTETRRLVLEIGSGTGGWLAAAQEAFPQVVGIDIALRWLHVSRRRFLDLGRTAPALVCCCAEYLPFPDGLFDLAVCCSTLEFTRSPGQALSECARALSGAGTLYLQTVNRFSVAPDPYAGLWGVGFLPRAWQAPYARWRRQVSYAPIRLLSLPELKRLAAASFPRVRIRPGDVGEETIRQLPSMARWQVQAYRRLKGLSLGRRLLRWVGPQWDVVLGKQTGPAPCRGAEARAAKGRA